MFVTEKGIFRLDVEIPKHLLFNCGLNLLNYTLIISSLLFLEVEKNVCGSIFGHTRVAP